MDKTRNYLTNLSKRNITDMTDIKKFENNAIQSSHMFNE